MEDLTGLGKLADSKVVNATYDDLVSKAAKEGGSALEDVVKAFRLFTAPIQLLAVAQDRLARFCKRVRHDVPEERQIEASPSVAIPILLALRYMEDDNLVTELFLNLLKRAIDRERVHEAHPAFPRIIEQLTPDEAMIMYSLREMDDMCVMPDVRQDNSFPFHRLMFPNNIKFYCRHLETLDLLNFPANAFIELSPFGFAFNEACVPDKIKGVAPFQIDNDNPSHNEV